MQDPSIFTIFQKNHLQIHKLSHPNLLIVFEDQNIIVINKPAGMAVHQGLGDFGNTVADYLAKYLDPSHSPSFYIAHRIDKHTSGLLVFAKNIQALHFLDKQFREHTVKRTYFCLVWGDPAQNEGKIESYIGRNPIDKKSIEISPDQSFGKHAITYYKVVEKYNRSSLVQCELETGRTHQIRIHMRSIGHSIISDQRYPNENEEIDMSDIANAATFLPHQALHAFSLGFINPGNSQKLYFECEFPADFQNLIQHLKNS